MIKGLGVEHRSFMAEEPISGMDDKQHGFLVIFHEHYIIQCSQPQVLTGWKPFVELLHLIQ